VCGDGRMDPGEACDPVDPEFPEGELDPCCNPRLCTRRPDATECGIPNLEEKLPFDACEVESPFGACLAGRCRPLVNEEGESCRAPGIHGPCDTGGRCDGATRSCPDAEDSAACEKTELEEASIKKVKATCVQAESAAQGDDAKSLCEVEAELLDPASGAGVVGAGGGELVIDSAKKMRTREKLLERLRKMRAGMNSTGRQALKNPTGCVQLRARVRIRQSSVSLVRDKRVVVCKNKRALKAWQAANGSAVGTR